MKVAVIGSRNFMIEDLGQYLPEETPEIVSGGAKGVDTCAREFASAKGLKLNEFLTNIKNTAEERRSSGIYRSSTTPTVCWRFGTGNREGRNSSSSSARRRASPSVSF